MLAALVRGKDTFEPDNWYQLPTGIEGVQCVIFAWSALVRLLNSLAVLTSKREKNNTQQTQRGYYNWVVWLRCYKFLIMCNRQQWCVNIWNLYSIKLFTISMRWSGWAHGSMGAHFGGGQTEPRTHHSLIHLMGTHWGSVCILWISVVRSL